jgi:hypothetical protein
MIQHVFWGDGDGDVMARVGDGDGDVIARVRQHSIINWLEEVKMFSKRHVHL